ncbi:hypothetical protein NIES4101_72480 [Calothrix sp. NIES-4101]|nr:hypothetical protein NIES4101_72480 [Calothrix sp. NIES-4101]
MLYDCLSSSDGESSLFTHSDKCYFIAFVSYNRRSLIAIVPPQFDQSVIKSTSFYCTEDLLLAVKIHSQHSDKVYSLYLQIIA